MLTFPNSVKILIALEPCDMRKSFNGLYTLREVIRAGSETFDDEDIDLAIPRNCITFGDVVDASISLAQQPIKSQ